MSSERALQSLAFRARLVKIFAWIFAAITLSNIALLGYIAFKPDDPIVVTAGGSGGDMTPTMVLAMAAGILSLLWLVSMALLVVFSLVWIHRAHSNVVDQGVPMDHSPGWTVASYFIPFVNLVVPYRAMRELHNRSHGEIPEHAHYGVEDVGAWWTAFMVGFFIQVALLLKFAINILTNLILYTPEWMEFAMSAFASLCFAGAAVMLVKLVGQITEAQRGSAMVGSAFE